MAEGKDFFVSYTGADKKWAEWIAWILEEAGYTTLIQAWDFKSAANFVLNMQEGATNTTRTIAVVTPDYFKSGFTKAEWAAAFACDPTGECGKLIAVRVADFKPPGLFAANTYIDLVGLDADTAKGKLLTQIEFIVKGKRLKPDAKPAFPGMDSPVTRSARPPFPGTPAGEKPFLHNLPFAPNPFFTGRDKMLDDLHTALQKKTAAAITQPQAVHGLGGVGKTQLGIEYAWKYQADYDVALWAGASSPAELHAKVAGLAAVLNLPEAAATQQEVKVQAVLDWLRSHQRWLLILDNADTKEAQSAVLKLLPPGLHGHVIVTSRLADWPVGYEDLEVFVLSEPAAKEFLLKRAHKSGFNPGSEADALAIAKELGCLPLALEQAGAYVARHHVSFVEYLKLLKESRAQLMKFPSQGGTGYQQTVATTWLVSEQQLSLTARVILQVAAFLAPDNIPRAMFIECETLVAEEVSALAKAANVGMPEVLSKQHIRDALAELADHSLIELEAETFSCHRLLQAALLDRLKKEDRQRWAETTLSIFKIFAPPDPDDVRTWPVWDLLSPHAFAILKEFWEQINPDVSGLMNQLGLFLAEKALYADAELLMRRALAIAERSLGPEHDIVAIRLNNLALLLNNTNRLDEAEPLMRRALVINEKNFGLEHPNVSIGLNNLAHLLQETNRIDETEPLMRRALAIAEKNFGPEHPQVATCLNNLATLLEDTNRLGEAEPFIRRALAIAEKNFGPEHPHVAIRLSNLALLLKDTNRMGEAEPVMRRALAIVEKNFDSEHPQIAILLNNLAHLLKTTNRMGEAEPLMRRALAIAEKSFGPEHPQVAILLNNLAQLLKDTNRLDEAETLTKRHVLILINFNKTTGHEHPHWKSAILNYRNLLVAMKLNKKQIDAKLREVVEN
jgi:tetratricopeptide (TPR) repeat protein